jgi:hypothetical protein
MQALGGARAEDKALEEDMKNGIIRPRKPVQNGLTVGGARVGEPGPGGGAPPAQGGAGTPTPAR